MQCRPSHYGITALRGGARAPRCWAAMREHRAAMRCDAVLGIHHKSEYTTPLILKKQSGDIRSRCKHLRCWMLDARELSQRPPLVCLKHPASHRIASIASIASLKTDARAPLDVRGLGL